jgi:Protein of unknown function (DUF3037)
MPDEPRNAYTYRVLRYTPNLVRDEWINIGVLLHDATNGRLRASAIALDHELRRVRRLHPDADTDLLRLLASDFERQIELHAEDLDAFLAKLDETLANVLQLSPRKGLLADNFEAELDRLYQEQVAPPRYRSRVAQFLENTRRGIRRRANDILRRAGILPQMTHNVRVEEFTYKGDPLRLDYAYRKNGTRGFAQALPLERDPEAAKVLAFTAERIGKKIARVEFTAITEVEPQRENEQHQFVQALLAEQNIALVPLARLDGWAHRLRAELRN